jgi:hypothetical protein
MMVKMLVLVFWVKMTCGLVGRYQCFRGTEEHTASFISPEYGGSMFLQNIGILPTSQHGITTHETNNQILIVSLENFHSPLSDYLIKANLES